MIFTNKIVVPLFFPIFHCFVFIASSVFIYLFIYFYKNEAPTPKSIKKTHINKYDDNKLSC